MGSFFRTRAPEAIVKEMAECQSQHGIEIFDIEDDNFTFDQSRAKRLMNLIIEKFGERKFELSAMNGVSFTSLDEELLRLMKRAGFHRINLSFVSTDPLTRERTRRPEPSAEFDQILDKAERVGLNVIAYAILGMPGQTIEEMTDTLIYLMGKRVLIGASIYYPTPGTPFFEICKEEGVLPPHFSQWRSSAFPVETKEFDRLDLLTLSRLTRVINFIKGKVDGRELDEGITWEEIFQFLEDKVEVKAKGIAWAELLLTISKNRSFFSLRKGAGGSLSAVKEVSSKKVLDYFFQKALGNPILKSRNV
jgi:hypothetical protein